MADHDFEGNVSIYINQTLCSYDKIKWSWSKKLHKMGRIYRWCVSDGTIKIKPHEHYHFVSVTHDFIRDFPGVVFTTCYNCK